MLRLSNLSLPLDFGEKELLAAAARKLKLPEKAVTAVSLARRSVDARKKQEVHFVCAAEVTVDTDEDKLLRRLRDKGVQKAVLYRYEPPVPKKPGNHGRPVVVGFGPAGMFAALLLSQQGLCPMVLERGETVEQRESSVQLFWEKGVLSPHSNVQFGEGGAGTFSDGKLNTGTGDPRIRQVLEELVKAGAPPQILTDAKPHVGTDRLPKVVKEIRRRVLSLGGEIFFGSTVTGLLLESGRLTGLKVKNSRGEQEVIPCSQVILAVGHSARDTFCALYQLGIPMQAKAFAVGARIEHPAALIDRAQYGSFAGRPALGAADYKLFCHLPSGRGVYTFCMCPGGVVTGAASEPGGVVTNGMSRFSRDGENSNSALLVGVGPEDYGEEGPLAGMFFQRRIEQAAFRLAGSNYSAPAQRVEDFLSRKPSRTFGGVLPTYQPGVVPASLDDCLPGFVTDAMREALPEFGRRLSGFDGGDAVLTAPETRSSSPVRILRGEDLQSPACKGLFPCGEGAGYAGGIVSAAVDGLRCAEQVIREW